MCVCLSPVLPRVRDTCIVVAVDEPPEEGLEQPLRLEKLANEVSRGSSSSSIKKDMCRHPE